MKLDIQFDSHYGRSMRAAQLLLWAERASESMYKMFKGKTKEFPVLVYSGMSGISTAIALSQKLSGKKLDFGMMYVRKPYEKSHGSKIEFNNLQHVGERKIRFVFCDDFISSGDTAIRVFSRIQERFEGQVNVDEILIAFTEYEDGKIVPIGDNIGLTRIKECLEKNFKKNVMPVLKRKEKATKALLSLMKKNEKSDESDSSIFVANYVPVF